MTWSYVGVAVWMIVGFWLGKTDYRLALLALAIISIQWANFDKPGRSMTDLSRIRSGSDNTAVGIAAGVDVEMWSKDVVTRLPKDADGQSGEAGGE